MVKNKYLIGIIVCIFEIIFLGCSKDKVVAPNITEWYRNSVGKDMTLHDLYELAAKGDNLLFEDFQQYNGMNASSIFGRYIMVYGIDGGYRLIVHSNPTGKPDRVNLESIWESNGSGIDIRHNNLHDFLKTTPSQNSITEYEAQNLAQAFSEFILEPVSWEILGDVVIPISKEAVFMQNLLDSLYKLPEPCWLFQEKPKNEIYLAVGKKTGIIYSGTSDLIGRINTWSEL